MIVPKLKQRKDGNWTCKVDKQTINLQTKTYSVARERAKEAAYEGKRDWSADRFYDKTPSTSNESAPSSAPLGDWQSDLADATSAGIKPDLYTGPDGSGVPLLGPADDAAPSSAPHTPDEPKKQTSSADSTEIPPEMFDGMMKQCAAILVEGQIRGQEWMIARFLKANAGPVPMNNIGRTAATQFWEQQLAKWIPKDVPLPEWAAALVVCAMFSVPVQLQGATPIEKAPESAPQTNYPIG